MLKPARTTFFGSVPALTRIIESFMSMKIFRKLPVVACLFLAFGLVAGRQRLAAQVENDPVAVPVGFNVEFYSTVSTETWCFINADPNTYAGNDSWAVGWNSGTEVFTDMIPGKEYTFTTTCSSNVDQFMADFHPPTGYRIVINHTEQKRLPWTQSTATPTPPTSFTIRLEDTSSVPTGKSSSLRPGRIIWSVGLGNLKNGRGAGSITMRQYSLTASTFTPSALIYENDSGEVEIIRENGALRQIYADSCLVDITADNDHAFRLDFYSRDSGQIGSKTTDANGVDVYSVSGTPLFEYIIENPDNPTLDAIRITKITTQGGAEYDSWTELKKVANPPDPSSEQWQLDDWCEKSSGATTVSSPVRQLWTYTNSMLDEKIQQEESDGTVVSSVHNVYQDFTWGRELVSATAGDGLSNSTTTTYDYYEIGTGNYSRLKDTVTTGGGWVMYDYYDDFDRFGEVAHVYRPYLGSPATPTADLSTTDATAYDYAADWSGVKCWPSSIVKSVIGTTVAKSTIDYTSDSLTDTSTTYTDPADATMPLVVATRKDYSDTSHYQTTVTKTFRGDADPENHFFPGLVHSVMRPDGTMSVTIYYRGLFNPSDRTFSAVVGGTESLAMTLNGTTQSTMSGATLISTNTRGDQSPTTESNFYVVNGKSSATLVVHGALGIPVVNETDAYLSSSWSTIQRDMTATINGLFPWYVSRDSGDPYTNWDIANNTWSKGRLDSSTDEAGIVSTFSYDAANRVSTVTRGGAVSGSTTINALTTTYSYDAAGHTTGETISGTGSETLVTSRAFDLAGRMTRETPPGLGATQYAYSPSTNTVTTTLPSGSTKVETRYAEGRIQQITGSAVVPQFYTYDATTGYVRINYASSSSLRLKEVWKDWLGRKTTTSHPGYTGQPAYQETNTYDPITGQLTKSTRTGFSDTIYQYDGMGQLVRSGLDVDGGGLALASSDRITDQDGFFESYSGAIWLTRTETEYPTAGSGTSQEVDRKRERLTGRSASLRAETREIDINNNEIVTTTTVDAANKLVTNSTSVPGLTTPEQAVLLDGLTISATGHDGVAYTQSYDGLSRASTVVDPRTGAKTTSYWSGTQLPYQTIDSRNVVLTTTWYDTSGRPTVVQEAVDSNTQSRVTRYAYTDLGKVQYRWGSGVDPVSFGYNTYGEQQTMSTYQDRTNGIDWNAISWPGGSATANATTWDYDEPSGLLHSKTDASSASVSYTYNSRGQVLTRTWARGNTTNYNYYSDTAELSTITYSDGTPTVMFSYDRLGHNTQVTDATGTRTLDRCTCGKLEDERFSSYYGNRALTYLFATSGMLGRRRGFQLGNTVGDNSELEQDLTYTGGGLVDTLTSGRSANAVQQSFQYGYTPNSDLVNGLTATNTSFSVGRGYDANRDLLTSISAQWGSTTKTSFAYTYTDAYRRQTVVQSGEAFTGEYGDSLHQIFEYTNRGELATAAAFLNGTATDQSTPMAARRFEYAYDAIGNRLSSNTSGNSSLKDGYTVNALNQYTDRNNNTLAVGGTAAASANVVASEYATARAGRAGEYWGDNVAVPNSSGPFYGPFTVYAALLGAGPNGTDLVRTETHTALVAAFGQHFSYDQDGNLTSDGVWDYSWDGENRLISVQTNNTAVTVGVPKSRVEFTYDYADRRVQKRVLAWDANANNWTVTRQRRYLYDFENLIAEFNVDPNTSALTLLRTYTWGLDVAGSIDASGGVGALIQITDQASGQSYFPTYDGNGNVAALVNASTGASAAAYEYGPFGEALRTSVYDSTMADQPFRFSTKAFDSETGLVYYGERYYDPANGRFLGRDPSEENGGLNLYGFAANDPINRWDYMGMAPSGDPSSESDTYEDPQPDGSVYVYSAQCDGEGYHCRWSESPTTIILPPFDAAANHDHPSNNSGPVTITIDNGNSDDSSSDSGGLTSGGAGNASQGNDSKSAPNRADDCAQRRKQLEQRKATATQQEQRLAAADVGRPYRPSVSDAAGSLTSTTGLLNGLLKNTAGGGSQTLSALSLFATSISFGEKIGTATAYGLYGTNQQYGNALWDAFTVGAKFVVSAQVGVTIAKNPTPVGIGAGVVYAFGGAAIKGVEYFELRGLEQQDQFNARQNLADREDNFLAGVSKLNSDINQYNHDCAGN